MSVSSPYWLMVCLGCFVSSPLHGASSLWQIGEKNHSAAELALGPDGFRAFERDAFYVVGESMPAEDWPYVHPGPSDTWAGAREHTFTILFGLKDTPSGKGRLAVGLLDTHSVRPPTLFIQVNGWKTEHQCLPGGGEGSIHGDRDAGRHHSFSVQVPEEVLEKGLNQVRITNRKLSWMVYDWVEFETEKGIKLAPARGARLLHAGFARRLCRYQGEWKHELSVDFVCSGEARELRIEAGDVQSPPLDVQQAEQTLVLRFPPVKERKEVTLCIRSEEGSMDQLKVSQPPASEPELVDYVDPLLGTSDSRWMLYPGPSAPFGMVKLSPDNQNQGWKAGYEYNIESIAGFSHLHSWTMGGLLTMPATGEILIAPGDEKDPDGGYRSRIHHETEEASPGYYAVTLDDYAIRAELTSTTRAGFQRYTYPKSQNARILVDLHIPTEYGFTLLDAKIEKVSQTEIVGHSKQRSGRGASYQEFILHFVARTDKPFTSMDGWIGDSLHEDVEMVSGQGDVGVALSFETSDGEEVLLQTGISLVSIEQARLNLKGEMDPFAWDFDACRDAAQQVWTDLLGLVEVEGGTEADRVKFYTNLYRSYCARTIWSDVDGKYVDMYEEIQQLADPDSPVYGCDAFWNTFWNLNPLWILVTPETANKWVKSLLEIYDKGGWLPKGPTGIEYSSIMVASHEIALMVAAYQAGVRDYDIEKAYEAMRHSQRHQGCLHPGGGRVGNMQLAPYMKLGYVPLEKGPISNTLEYAYDDWCVGQMAHALGEKEDAKLFLDRAQYYKNVFDPTVGYVRKKHADGRWVEPFDPFDRKGYVEGNAWQYTWFVPQDVGGLIELMGGKEVFTDRLIEGLQKAGPRFTSRYVNHGNQPNMQSSWLFNYAGSPWLTQYWTREILDRYYGIGPVDGYPGDEDQGQMGAWFVMSAMGLFQMDGGCACKPVYEISSPLFERVVIHLDPRYYQGKTFVIEAPEASKRNRYIQSATLNGQPLMCPWFYANELSNGGELRLDLGPEPNKNWGASLDAAPPSIPRW